MTYRFSDIFENHSYMLNSNLNIKDFKYIVEQKTKIKSSNQRFMLSLDFYSINHNDEANLWNYIGINIQDISNIPVLLSKGYYEEKILLDFNNNVEQLKKKISELKNIPEESQKFLINNDAGKATDHLSDDNIFENKYSIEIFKTMTKSLIYLKYPNGEIKEKYIDLIDTGMGMLEEIENVKFSRCEDIKYDLYYNGQFLPLNELLIFYGIKPGNTIELKERDNLISFFVRTLNNKTITISMHLYEKVSLLKAFIKMKEGYLISNQRLYYTRYFLEDNRDLEYYNIQRDSDIKMK